MSDTEELLDKGLGHHQAGRLREAQQVYQEILRGSPLHADALHLLGLLHRQQGRHEAAIENIRRALGVEPRSQIFWQNLSAVYHELGRYAEAADASRQVLRLNPNNSKAYRNLGCALQDLGDLDSAVANFRCAIQINPNATEVYLNLSNTLRDLGKLDEAASSLKKALKINPDYAEAHSNLGGVLHEQGKLEEAASSLKKALRINPDYAEAHSNLGGVLHEQGRLDEAASSLKKALEINPDYAKAHGNLGCVLREQGKLDEAASSLKKALEIDPNYAKAHSNLGCVLRELGKLDEAASSLQKALKIDPDYAEAHMNLGITFLQMGNFEAGWSHYEWRWGTKNKVFKPRNFSQPPWDGRALEGKSLLLHAEQGLGDTLQFVRYASLVQQRGCRVILECQEALQTLLSGCTGIDQLVARGEALPPFDFHVPLLSLPRLLGTHAGNIPANVPYLFAREDLVRFWQDRLSDGNGFKVGICWQGSPMYVGDRQRSFALAHFAALAEIRGVQLISLQKGVGTEQLADVRFPVTTLGAEVDEANGAFTDTAAVMKNLDLVISPDTAVVHLAGALGVPVWVVLQKAPDWRWLPDREDSLWYPTMRLFHQEIAGDWSPVFRRIAEALRVHQSNLF